MTIGDRVLACLHRAAESDAEFAKRERTAWDGWCDAQRVRRWLAAAADGKMPAEETLGRALAQLVRAGKAERRDGRWRVVPG
jgi:hypothetical protein